MVVVRCFACTIFFFLYVCAFLFFFFSSRRRHTRCSRDWSSDVCSSDLLRPNGSRLSCGRNVASPAVPPSPSSASHLEADDDWEEGRRRTGPARARSTQGTTIAETPVHVHVSRLEEHCRDRTTQYDPCAKVPRKGGLGAVRGGEKAGVPSVMEMVA